MAFPDDNMQQKIDTIITRLAQRQERDTHKLLKISMEALACYHQAETASDSQERKGAVNKLPDIRPQLEFIGKAIRENTLAVKANTEAINAQIKAMLRDKTVTYDYEGRITKVSVGN